MKRGGPHLNQHRLYGTPMAPCHSDLSDGCYKDSVNLRHLRCKDRAFLVSLLDTAVEAARKAGVELRYNLNATLVPDEGWVNTVMGTPFGPVRLLMRLPSDAGKT